MGVGVGSAGGRMGPIRCGPVVEERPGSGEAGTSKSSGDWSEPTEKERRSSTVIVGLLRI